MSWKEDYIAKFGEDTYAKRLAVYRKEYEIHQEERQKKSKEWTDANPETLIKNNIILNRKGSERNKKKRKYMQTGIQGEREKVRGHDRRQWQQYKRIIAPDSQIHHQWVPETANYMGLALVERDRHMHGFINVIEILDGKITLFTEEEISRSYIEQ